MHVPIAGEADLRIVAKDGCSHGVLATCEGYIVEYSIAVLQDEDRGCEEGEINELGVLDDHVLVGKGHGTLR